MIYKKVRYIQKGTFCKVYEAIDVENNFSFAVKEYELKTLISNFAEVIHEINFLKMANHHNIIKMYDIYYDDKILKIFMELSTIDLYDHMVNSPILDEDYCNFILLQMLNGVNYIHCMGYHHEDIKPENILIDNVSLVKIIDYNFCNRFYRRHLFKVGTVSYNPFEKLAGILTDKPLDEMMYDKLKIDSFAVGKSYLEMIDHKTRSSVNDYMDCMMHLLQVIGHPSQELIDMFPPRQQEDNTKTESGLNLNRLLNNAQSMYVKRASNESLYIIKNLLYHNSDERATVYDIINNKSLQHIFKKINNTLDFIQNSGKQKIEFNKSDRYTEIENDIKSESSDCEYEVVETRCLNRRVSLKKISIDKCESLDNDFYNDTIKTNIMMFYKYKPSKIINYKDRINLLYHLIKKHFSILTFDWEKIILTFAIFDRYQEKAIDKQKPYLDILYGCTDIATFFTDSQHPLITNTDVTEHLITVLNIGKVIDYIYDAPSLYTITMYSLLKYNLYEKKNINIIAFLCTILLTDYELFYTNVLDKVESLLQLITKSKQSDNTVNIIKFCLNFKNEQNELFVTMQNMLGIKHSYINDILTIYQE